MKDWFDYLFAKPEPLTIRYYDVWVEVVSGLDMANVRSNSKELLSLIAEYLQKEMIPFDFDFVNNRLIVRTLIRQTMLPEIVKLVREKNGTTIVKNVNI